MQKAGYLICVFASADGYEAQLPDFVDFYTLKKLNPTGKNPFRDYKLIAEIEKNIVDSKVDLMFSFTPKGNIYGALAARRANIICVPTVNGLGRIFNSGGILKTIVIYLYRRSFKNIGLVFFQNSEDLQLFIDRKIVRFDQAEIVAGSGVNLSVFKPRGKIIEKGNPLILTYAGRLLPEKGVFDYIHAVQQIKDRSECTFQLVGKHPDNHSSGYLQ